MNVMIGNRWTKHDVHQFLVRGQWFGSLPAPMQETILARSDIVHFPTNAVLYKFGDAVDGVYAALDGDLRAYANGGDGERFFFRALGPGSWFGDANLLDPQSKRMIDVCAASAATALFLPQAAYHELTESDPAIYRAFVQLLCMHARYASRIVIETRSEAPMRTARALLRLARAHGVAGGEGTRLAMNLSQADLASLVGVSRQYMNELIARWEQEGLLRWNGKAQPLLDTERLHGLLGPLDAWIREHEDWV
jgi:CRP/FNR family transcriptional regulator, cyclic AMP receptor protein